MLKIDMSFRRKIQLYISLYENRISWSLKA